MGKFSTEITNRYGQKTARVIEVPEWPEGFQRLYIFPLTLLQASRYEKEKDPLIRAARVVQVRACDDQGKRLFDDDDFDTLCSHGIEEFGPVTVYRVAAEINSDIPTAAELEKKLKMNPDS